MAGKRGGARPGAGRKKKGDKFAGQVARAEQRIADRLPELVDLMLVLARGVKVKVEIEAVNAGADGGRGVEVEEVWEKYPDRSALVYLIDRVLGKPTERHELTGEDGAPFKVYVGIDVDRV